MNLRFIAIMVLGFSWLSSVSVAAGEGSCRAVEVKGEVAGYDDLDGSGLVEAVEASLKAVSVQPANKEYYLCDRKLTVSDMRETLVDFLDLYRQEGSAPGFFEKVRERFSVYGAANPDGVGKVLVTGYFEPVLEGSLERIPPFIHPLYKVPGDLVKRGDQIGRMKEGRLVPYWSREEIEDQNLLAGNELVFVRDPVKAFVLHVQGSGRIRLRDGMMRRIQFAAKNGLPYRSIGRLLAERGIMELEKVSLPAIIDYLEEHPEERREILQHNASFVFFRWGDNSAEGPLGSLGEPLTAGRSVALDRGYYPPGMVGILKSRKPLFDDNDKVVGWAPFQRFVLNQDSGSAIRGEGRVDLFLGSGDRAGIAAGIMKPPGELYLLVKKK